MMRTPVLSLLATPVLAQPPDRLAPQRSIDALRSSIGTWSVVTELLTRMAL